MVLAEISLLVGLIGFGWAGWKDLKTTEFPDWIPYSLIVAALLLRGVFSFLQQDVSLLINSVLVGLVFLGFGLALYYAKQWGDGDAWLLGAMGFLYPDGLGFLSGALPFPILLLFNFFIVAFLYIVVYSLLVGIKSKQSKKFFRGFKKDVVRIVLVTAVFTIALVGFFFSAGIFSRLLFFVFLFPLFLFLLLVFLQYGRFVEKTLFKKRIDVKSLREGDVPLGEKWRVLSKKEVALLRKRGGNIWIKEGIRFAPVFVLTLILMLTYGNLWEVLGLLF